MPGTVRPPFDPRGRSLLPATGLAGGLAFAFTLLAARALGPSRFGALSALLQCVNFVALPIGALSAAVAKVLSNREAAQSGAGRRLARGVIGPALLAGAGAAGLVTALALGLRRQLGVDPPSVFILGSVAGVSVIVAIARGVAWGLRHYMNMSLSIVGEAAVRTVAGLLVARALPEVYAFLGCSTIGGLAAAAICASALPKDSPSEPAPILVVLKSTGLLAIANGLMQILSLMDVVVARVTLPAAEAGSFAAAATLTKAGLLVQAAVGTIVFRDALNSEQPYRSMLRGVGLTGCLVGLGIIPSLLFPHWVMRFIFDSKYEGGALLLGPLAVGMTLLSSASVAAQFSLAQAPKRAIWALALAALAGVIAYSVHHATSHEVAQSFLVGPIALVLGLATTASPHNHKIKPSLDGGPS